MLQITTRLSPKIRDRFERYAAKLGLDASELARLLIVREIRIRRLPRLAKSRPSAVTPPKGTGERKLTAHFRRELRRQVVQFTNYAYSEGLSREAAVRLIAEQELCEKWLAKVLGCTPRKRPTSK